MREHTHIHHYYHHHHHSNIHICMWNMHRKLWGIYNLNNFRDKVVCKDKDKSWIYYALCDHELIFLPKREIFNQLTPLNLSKELRNLKHDKWGGRISTIGSGMDYKVAEAKLSIRQCNSFREMDFNTSYDSYKYWGWLSKNMYCCVHTTYTFLCSFH